jgi:DNA-binding response OmpR family regulator
MSRSLGDARVLVIDDDEVARELVHSVLERAGVRVREAPDGRAGLRELYAASPDLVILDVEMPELDGWATLERIRDLSDVPVLMLTARETELERVRGLRGGADDYVVKPFGHQELLARVQALLRRAALAQARGDRDGDGLGAGRGLEGYVDARLEIDVPQRAVRYEHREVRLTPLEFKLLLALVRHPGQVLSRDQLLELVWGDALGVSPEQVKLYVGYLRHKLDPERPQDTPIETVRGFGYRYQRT